MNKRINKSLVATVREINMIKAINSLIWSVEKKWIDVFSLDTVSVS